MVDVMVFLSFALIQSGRAEQHDDDLCERTKQSAIAIIKYEIVKREVVLGWWYDFFMWFGYSK